MATADHSKFATLAETLLAKHGRSVTLSKTDRTPTSASKRWEGVDPDAASSPTTVTVTAVITAMSVRERAASPKGATERAFIAANEDGGNDLRLFDEMRDGSESWRIVGGDLVKPGDTKIMHTLELQGVR